MAGLHRCFPKRGGLGFFPPGVAATEDRMKTKIRFHFHTGFNGRRLFRPYLGVYTGCMGKGWFLAAPFFAVSVLRLRRA